MWKWLAKGIAWAFKHKEALVAGVQVYNELRKKPAPKDAPAP